MNTLKHLLKLLIIVGLLQTPLFADLVFLQRGDTLQGQILSQDKDSVVMVLTAYRTHPRYIVDEKKIDFDTFYTMKIKKGPTLSDYDSYRVGESRLMMGKPILLQQYSIPAKKVTKIIKTRSVILRKRGEKVGKPVKMVRLEPKFVVLENIHKESGIESLPRDQVAELIEGKIYLIEDKSEFIRYYKPIAGIIASPAIPVGGISSFLSAGIGGSVFFEGYMNPEKISFLNFQRKAGLRIYSGIYGGYSLFQKNTDSYVTKAEIVPVVLYSRVVIPTKIAGLKLQPYARLGGGLTMTRTSKTFTSKVTGGSTAGNASASVSSFDGTFLGGAGLGFPIGKSLLVFFEGSYLIAFEEVSGHFAQAGMGVGWIF